MGYRADMPRWIISSSMEWRDQSGVGPDGPLENGLMELVECDS